VIGVIFGPPGSGKGTQAALVQKSFGMDHLSTGEILRAEVAHGSPVGHEAARIMAAGDLVPDDLITHIVKRRLGRAHSPAGVLLDGFPRTVEQAKALDAMLAKQGRKVDFVIAIDVPENILVQRLIKRAAAEGRADDNRKAIAERMHEYRTLTEAVLEHYRGRRIRVIEIAGVGEVEAVFERIQKELSRAGGDE
jgi:adenylate kinase